jgi:hypothetical protein
MKVAPIPWAPRDPAHETAEDQRIVRRLQRIVGVVEVDFELARPIFGDQRVRRQPLGDRARPNGVENAWVRSSTSRS